jgi:hypothetical protein
MELYFYEKTLKNEKKITIFYKKIEKNWRFTFDIKNRNNW